MPRVFVDVPDFLPFSTEITLYQSHMNTSNHLDNALLLTVVSEARERFFQFLGYRELDVEGVGILVADAALQYLAEARHGEVMVVAMGATDFSRCGCDLVWRMRARTDGREIARGKTGIVFFDYPGARVVAVPEPFRHRCG